jgi:hypothetical protein
VTPPIHIRMSLPVRITRRNAILAESRARIAACWSQVDFQVREACAPPAAPCQRECYFFLSRKDP